MYDVIDVIDEIRKINSQILHFFDDSSSSTSSHNSAEQQDPEQDHIKAADENSNSNTNTGDDRSFAKLEDLVKSRLQSRRSLFQALFKSEYCIFISKYHIYL